MFSSRELQRIIDNFVNGFVEKYADFFEEITTPLLSVLLSIEKHLRATPWWVVVIIVALISIKLTKNWKLVSLNTSLLLFIWAIEQWDNGMQTLSLMLVSLFLAIIIGIPLGVLMSSTKILQKIMLPVLDIMQTMPSFVYLIPIVMLFGLGKVPALIATVIYAIPPLIRLTELGIRQVDKSVLEASHSFGASRLQKLIGIQIPLALPSIMTGINQSIMMALSMAVIASMIGAKGLGQEVLIGINRLEIGRGLLAGLAIVALAIVFDRLTQAYGNKINYLHKAK